MSKWPMVKLGEISKAIDYGVTASANFEGNGYKFLRITDIQNNTVSWGDVPWCACTEKEAATALLVTGDIVFARTGATTGKSYLIKNCPEQTVFASYLIRVRLGPTANATFISWFFQSSFYWQQITNNARGAAQPGINSSVLRTLLIPLPALPEQQRIVELLDRAQALIDRRKEQLALMDSLVQSVFYEMFGDPVKNEKGWERGVVGDLLAATQYGTAAKADTETGQYPIIRMGNITYFGSLDFSDLKYIDIEEKDKAKYFVQKGELLFNRTNSKELVGKTAVFREEVPMVFAGYLIRMTPNSKANAEYISAFLNSIHGKKILLGMAKNIVGMANINAEELKSISILIPPIELQNQFAERIEIILTEKQKMAASLKELENNFNALMQEAFE